MYNSRPRKVAVGVYHYPSSCYIKTEDPDLPAFYFDPVINPITSIRRAADAVGKCVRSFHRHAPNQLIGLVVDPDEEDGEVFALPERVNPFLKDTPLYTDRTAPGDSRRCTC